MAPKNSEDSINTKKIGLIINPIAGMGGSVGLKGTDGNDVLEKALQLGATPRAQNRCQEFLEELLPFKNSLDFITCPNEMGESVLKLAEFSYQIVDIPEFNPIPKIFETKQDHTISAAKKMSEMDVSIVIFVGGDGTARNIYEAIGVDFPCLGIPGGVKIHSSVFAINPKSAALMTIQYLWNDAPLRESEVMDIDEDAFRDNRVISKLYGYLKTPYLPQFIQASKEASPQTDDEYSNQSEIAEFLVEQMDEDTTYFLGPGTTTRAIAEILGIKKTLLGVDLVKNKTLIAMDLNEQQILKALEQKQENPVKIIVTPIGAQGFVFGRGNLQISDKVLEKIKPENIIIVCTNYKFSTLPDGKLRIDSRNPAIDSQMRGFYRVIVGYAHYKIAEMI